MCASTAALAIRRELIDQWGWPRSTHAVARLLVRPARVGDQRSRVFERRLIRRRIQGATPRVGFRRPETACRVLAAVLAATGGPDPFDGMLQVFIRSWRRDWLAPLETALRERASADQQEAAAARHSLASSRRSSGSPTRKASSSRASASSAYGQVEGSFRRANSGMGERDHAGLQAEHPDRSESLVESSRLPAMCTGCGSPPCRFRFAEKGAQRRAPRSRRSMDQGHVRRNEHASASGHRPPVLERLLDWTRRILEAAASRCSTCPRCSTARVAAGRLASVPLVRGVRSRDQARHRDHDTRVSLTGGTELSAFGKRGKPRSIAMARCSTLGACTGSARSISH